MARTWKWENSIQHQTFLEMASSLVILFLSFVSYLLSQCMTILVFFWKKKSSFITRDIVPFSMHAVDKVCALTYLHLVFKLYHLPMTFLVMARQTGGLFFFLAWHLCISSYKFHLCHCACVLLHIYSLSHIIFRSPLLAVT